MLRRGTVARRHARRIVNSRSHGSRCAVRGRRRAAVRGDQAEFQKALIDAHRVVGDPSGCPEQQAHHLVTGTAQMRTTTQGSQPRWCRGRFGRGPPHRHRQASAVRFGEVRAPVVATVSTLRASAQPARRCVRRRRAVDAVGSTTTAAVHRSIRFCSSSLCGRHAGSFEPGALPLRHR